MTALSTLVPALQRELAVPGTFETVFPDTSEDDLTASLADGFAEAQLRGFFPQMELIADQDDWDTSSDLSVAGGALVILFTSMRFIRAQLRVLNTSERYKAGPTEMEVTRGANLLRDELKFMEKRLQDLIDEAKFARRAGRSASVHDNYLARGGGITSGFFRYEAG